jgi:hypothetical protein
LAGGAGAAPAGAFVAKIAAQPGHLICLPRALSSIFNFR